ncbi:N-acetylglucosaminidase [Virgibacillus sp. SK37]|uniref:N-acetylglucosaminidase n=1 Tax=Virgibacillus sp. SK37 TaxID=403957 RepID=UPI0004D1E95E|nr:SH3 domain-containing protein [Virgibacillus sp. SK37]AIF45597.1 hypothetical protein X953_16960 [Virgibacillus sp. SK37]
MREKIKFLVFLFVVLAVVLLPISLSAEENLLEKKDNNLVEEHSGKQSAEENNNAEENSNTEGLNEEKLKEDLDQNISDNQSGGSEEFLPSETNIIDKSKQNTEQTPSSNSKDNTEEENKKFNSLSESNNLEEDNHKQNNEKIKVNSTKIEKTSTSKLGHIRSNSVIYPDIENRSNYEDAAPYTNAVYYIKRQAKVNGELFYLISKRPSSSHGVVGWLKASDLSVHTHTSVDSKAKTFYLKGTGSAYSKAWGGVKDLVYSDLTSYQLEEFKVDLTEKIGNNIWYRGVINGKTAWLHSSYVTSYNNKKLSYYNLTLQNALDMQMSVQPQTDKEYKTYVSKGYINKYNKVTADVLNVRGGPSTDYWVVGKLNKGSRVTILDEVNEWYQIEFTQNYQWVNASPTDVLYYLDPNNFINNEKQRFQFLDLSRSNVASVEVLNNQLINKGSLENKGKQFIEAGNKNSINEIYLLSHALLETGNGTSILANGVPVDNNGNVTYIEVLIDGKKENIPGENSNTAYKVFNMYGIGANDDCALECGAKKAFEKKWFDIDAAITGGAKFIKDKYIGGSKNTLYKMRWNPLNMEINKKPGGQYATDIGWAYKQIHSMYNLYQELESYTLYLDIPVYKN